MDGTGVTAPAAEEFRRWLPSCRVAGTLAAVQRPPEPPARIASAEGFVSLFNGRDLTGWTDVLHNECSWKVSGGLLASGRAEGNDVNVHKADAENKMTSQ